MKNEILKAEDANVILVDWKNGSTLPYGQAVANAKIVGIEIAKLINFMIEQKNMNASNFHLIGFSLGAHIAG